MVFIKNFIANSFNFYTEDQLNSVKKQQFLAGIREQEKRQDQLKTQCETTAIEVNFGKPIIHITNEWDDPVVGVVIGVEFFTLSKRPIAKVFDFVSNSRYLKLRY